MQNEHLVGEFNHPRVADDGSAVVSIAYGDPVAVQDGLAEVG